MWVFMYLSYFCKTATINFKISRHSFSKHHRRNRWLKNKSLLVTHAGTSHCFFISLYTMNCALADFSLCDVPVNLFLQKCFTHRIRISTFCPQLVRLAWRKARTCRLYIFFAQLHTLCTEDKSRRETVLW